MIIAQRSRLKLIPFKSARESLCSSFFRAFWLSTEWHRSCSRSENGNLCDSKHFFFIFPFSLSNIEPKVAKLQPMAGLECEANPRTAPDNVSRPLTFQHALSPCCAERSLRSTSFDGVRSRKNGKMRGGKMCVAFSTVVV